MKLDKHPKAKALIFDLDGTLSNSLPVHIDAWRTTCKKYNCEYDVQLTFEMTGAPTIRFAERVIADNKLMGIDPQEMVRFKQQTFWDSLDKLQGHARVIDLVKRYHGKVPMAIGTGANRISAKLQLEKLGIINYFDVIVTADDVTNHKPEPETFLKCAELLGVEPSSCQVLEDGEYGMRAAVTAGMYLTDVRPFTEN